MRMRPLHPQHRIINYPTIYPDSLIRHPKVKDCQLPNQQRQRLKRNQRLKEGHNSHATLSPQRNHCSRCPCRASMFDNMGTAKATSTSSSSLCCRTHHLLGAARSSSSLRRHAHHLLGAAALIIFLAPPRSSSSWRRHAHHLLCAATLIILFAPPHSSSHMRRRTQQG